MTEQQLQDAVAGMARALGWRVAHARPASTERGWRTPWEYDGKGFPDLTMARGHRLVFAELKAGRNKLEPEQELWLELLGQCCHEVFVWRPEDWTSGLIERVLRLEPPV